MSYFRQKIDPGPFEDLLPDGAEMYQRPELPTLEFELDGVIYTLPDLRLLHPVGIIAFNACLNEMINDPDARECRARVAADTDDDTLLIAEDIVLGFRYGAKKKGKNGWEVNSGIILRVNVEHLSNGDRILTFEFERGFAQYAYEYAQINNIGGVINLPDLIMYAARRLHEEFQYFCDSEEEQKKARENAKMFADVIGDES